MPLFIYRNYTKGGKGGGDITGENARESIRNIEKRCDTFHINITWQSNATGCVWFSLSYVIYRLKNILYSSLFKRENKLFTSVTIKDIFTYSTSEKQSEIINTIQMCLPSAI